MSLHVDDLMEELRARADAAQRSHAQFEELLDAVTAISEDLELSEVLGRIVRSACALVNARYGALGVLGPDGEHLMEFVTHGVSAQERERIGDLPSGHGILGLLIRDPRPQRLSDIGAHPDSVGFPPNHPPMTSFLGTPIRIRDEVFGNLYLAERQGEKEFSEADEAMLVALAGAAGFAIENARLYERSRQQRLWAQAIGELTQSLLESPDEDTALMLLVEQVVRLSEAQVCLVALRDEEGAPTRVRALHRRDEAAPLPAWREWPPLETREPWSQVLGSDQHLLLIPGPQSSATGRVPVDLAQLAGLAAPGPTALLTMSAGRGGIGHLVVQWPAGHEDSAAQGMPALSAFAQQAALGLVAARAQQDRQLLAMLEDRDRIARDMHDHVIQRLFATGLSLQAAARLAVHPVVKSRLDEAVDSLDEAIKVIRSTIFELHTMAAGRTIEEELEDVVTSYTGSLGFTPLLEVHGHRELDDAGLRADLLAVAREALANVSRHARAHSATVVVSFGASVRVEVTDDGVGVAATGRRSGLANLNERATSRSGTLRLAPAEPSGTRLVWEVPLAG
jgi:signal transduction histidine kinase